MRIAITIDEVLRDTLTQLHYIYEKYVARVETEYDDMTSTDFMNYFQFSSKELYNKFLYESASMEIFGFAEQMRMEMFERINDFLYDFYADKEHEIVVISKEHGRSVGATLFFLSKTGSNFRKFEMLDTYDDVWDKYDVIITATPEVLLSKPENKVSVKVLAPYNKDVESNHTIEKIEDMFSDEEFYNKIN